jgi:hypothetical protein
MRFFFEILFLPQDRTGVDSQAWRPKRLRPNGFK